MFLRQIDLTTALRPSLLPEETLLFVQDAVGLYEGKFKLPNHQNGHAYLTSHRACYVDHEDPRKYSVGIDLKDVERAELYAGFLKSSAKITLFPKPNKRASLTHRAHYSPRVSGVSSPARADSPARIAPSPPLGQNATWICPICSFSNPVLSNFDPALANSHTSLPPCLACGIKPALNVVVKAALAAMTNRKTETPAEPGTFRCPRCTFENHPSLLNCEICGQSLVSAADKRLDVEPPGRAESPGPSLTGLNLNEEIAESVKFSFRAGGEKIFNERLRNALVQRKWLLQSAPPIPLPVISSRNGNSAPGSTASSNPAQKLVGIAGLERRGQDLRKNNEMLIGNAFEDLEALMTSAKEIIALAEQFSSQANGDKGENELLSQSASALGFVTTKDTLKSDTLYISELSRNLAEFLTDDTKGVLKNEGGIMSLVDLWAVFNRARGGVELVSPTDFSKAAEMWDKLKLPVRLRRFRSGLLVVQGRNWTDEKTIAAILAWLKETHVIPPEGTEVTWDWERFGKGITAQETAERFGWSVGVATEELEMAEEKGALCREVGLDGLRFWENWIVQLASPEQGV